MATYLPLRYINVEGICVPVHRIVLIAPITLANVKQTVSQQKKAKTLINAARAETTNGVIFLDNGVVIASSLSPETLANKVNRLQDADMREEIIKASVMKKAKKLKEEKTIEQLMKEIKEAKIDDIEETNDDTDT